MILFSSDEDILMDLLIFAAGDHVTNVWDVLLQTAPILLAVATLITVLKGQSKSKEAVKEIKADVRANTELTQKGAEANEVTSNAVDAIGKTVTVLNNHTKELADGVQSAKTTAAKITELERLLREAKLDQP